MQLAIFASIIVCTVFDWSTKPILLKIYMQIIHARYTMTEKYRPERDSNHGLSFNVRVLYRLVLANLCNLIYFVKIANIRSLHYKGQQYSLIGFKFREKNSFVFFTAITLASCKFMQIKIFGRQSFCSRN